MNYPYDFAWLATAHVVIPELLYSPSFPIRRVTSQLASYDIDAWERNRQEYMAARTPQTTTTWPSVQTHPSPPAAPRMDSLLAALTTLAAGPTFATSTILGDDLDRFFGASVPIRPTAAQLTNGTTVSAATEESDCTICQDTISVGHPIRELTTCRHKFHRSCIDQWLSSHVTCPVCRHDLREPAAPTPAAASHSAAASS